MSSESIGANEFPDRVGAKPENPLAASFRPYIPASVVLPELTILPLIIGTLLGMIFGASSLWLVLKVGLTVSASIPVAVISISLFRILSKAGIRNATILENNIVQTAGSAGESIAFGVGGARASSFVMAGLVPAIHALQPQRRTAWMRGTSPRMTQKKPIPFPRLRGACHRAGLRPDPLASARRG